MGLLVDILDPVAPMPMRGHLKRVYIERVNGLRVGMLLNGWRSWEYLSDQFRRDLHNGFGIESFDVWRVPLGSAPDEVIINEVVESTDLVFVGLANCGSCTVCSVGTASVLTEAGLPVSVAVTENFVPLARSLAGNSEALVEFPSDLEEWNDERLASGAKLFLQHLIGAITSPGSFQSYSTVV